MPNFRSSEIHQALSLKDFDANGQLHSKKPERDDDVDMTDENEDEEHVISKMIKVDIIYNSGQVLCSGWGNTKHAAERNASI